MRKPLLTIAFVLYIGMILMGIAAVMFNRIVITPESNATDIALLNIRVGNMEKLTPVIVLQTDDSMLTPTLTPSLSITMTPTSYLWIATQEHWLTPTEAFISYYVIITARNGLYVRSCPKVDNYTCPVIDILPYNSRVETFNKEPEQSYSRHWYERSEQYGGGWFVAEYARQEN